MDIDFFQSFIPYGHCYYWHAGIIWAVFLADVLIALSCFSIAVVLIILIRKNPLLTFNNVLLLFAFLFFFSAILHIIDIWNIWYGHYGVQSVIKMITAIISVLTAWVVWKIQPLIVQIQGDVVQKTIQYERENSELQSSNNILHDQVDSLVEELHKKNTEVTLKNEALEERAALLTQKNEELQQFAYITSHDLRAPLRNIAGFVQLLARQYSEQLDDKGRDYIARTVNSTEKLQSLIDDILIYSRVESQGNPFSLIKLSEVYDETLINLATEIKESRAQISCTDLPEVYADRSQMIQLFSNFMTNSIKYCDKQEPVIEVSTTQDSQYWHIHFKDNGIGIEQKFYARIFDIFQRLHSDDEYPGTGIGLAVCLRVARRHNGDISIESKPGQGSTFTLHLPI